MASERSWSRVVMACGVVAAMAGTAVGQSDGCAGAPELTLGVLQVDGSRATPDGADACRTGAADVWYSFTAPRDGVLKLNACMTPNGTPVFSVHTGCPGTTANLIACNYQDSYQCGYRPHLEISCVAGRTYMVRVGGGGWPYTVSAWFEDPKPPAGIGPDVVSGDIPEMRAYQTAGDYAAYAFGSTACNIGDEEAIWTNQNNSNQHPVISTSIYRIKEGVFEQLGYAWLKHGWASGTETFCDYCPQEGVLPVLLPGCSDSYDVPQNGTQQILGRRSEVNPTTGIFPYPPMGNPVIADSTSRRIRVPIAGVDPARNAGAVYLGELQYVAADDALADNAMNNVSYREISFPGVRSEPLFEAPIARTKPAIVGWAEADPTVAAVPVDFWHEGYRCRFWVASKVTEVSPGRWRYVYAVFNLNADRAAGGFMLNRLAGTRVLDRELRFAPAHSGEVYDTTPWAFVDAGGQMGWRATQTHEQNVNANAIRWGTTFTMIVESASGPAAGRGRVELFAPGDAGDPSYVEVSLPVPGRGACLADFDGDGFIGPFDYGSFVTMFETGDESADVNGDGFIDFFDYGDFVAAFEAGC